METGFKGLFRPLRMVLAAGLMGPSLSVAKDAGLHHWVSDTYNDRILLLMRP